MKLNFFLALLIISASIKLTYGQDPDIKEIRNFSQGFNGSDILVLNWEYVSQGVEYKIFDCNNNLLADNINKPKHVFENLDSGKKYQFKVIAYQDNNIYAESKCLEIKTAQSFGF